MRQFVRKIALSALLFFGVLGLGLALIALSTNWTLQFEYKYFGHRTHWGSSLERVAEFENWSKQQSKTPKGLILGSSTAYRNLNPYILAEKTKVNWFNYGSSSQSVKMSYYLLAQALHKSHLDYVLLDIYPPIAENDGLEAAFDLLYNSELPFWQKTQLLSHYPNVSLWLRSAYFYTKKIVPCRTYIIQDSTNGAYLGRGFVCSNQAPLQENKMPQKKLKVKDLETLHEIAKLCKQHHTKLILNISPQLGTSYCLHPNYHKFKVLASLNFQNPQHFYDSHHMTCAGAHLYSERLAMKLKSMLYETPPPASRQNQPK